MEVNYRAALLDIAVADLGTLVIRTGFATVHHFGLEVVPQPLPSAFAVLNVTGWGTFSDRRRAGLCAMLAGRARCDDMLWACYLSAWSPQDEEPQWLCASLLVDPTTLAQTHRIAVRASGGLFPEQTPSGPAVAPDPGT